MFFRLKNLFMTLFILLISNQAFAADKSVAAKSEVSTEQSLPIQWVRYLSDADKGDITAQMAAEEYRRREADGTLYEEIQEQEISFPVSFIPMDSTSGPIDRVAAASQGGGNVTCNINVQNPHAGSGPGGSRVVKAKSSGSCTYVHVYGSPPPWVKWDLTQALFRIVSAWPVTLDTQTAVHSRTSLNPVWSASSAQVYHPNCINDSYMHINTVFIIPPPGWVYTGPQPVEVPNGASAVVNNC
ncbi:MAG: hypothetical protein AAGI44_19395 [Pseudomonadota bacterium]